MLRDRIKKVLQKIDPCLQSGCSFHEGCHENEELADALIAEGLIFKDQAVDYVEVDEAKTYKICTDKCGCTHCFTCKKITKALAKGDIIKNKDSNVQNMPETKI